MLTLQQQKLQTEVLANHLHLQHKNEVLQQLQTRLSDTDININQVVKEVGRVDKDFEKAKFRIQEVHPDFFRSISEKSAAKTYGTRFKILFLYLSGNGYKTNSPSATCGTKECKNGEIPSEKKFGLDEDTDLDTFFSVILGNTDRIKFKK